MIHRLHAINLLVRRATPGRYENGLWVDGGYVDDQVLASVQPANKFDLDSIQSLMGGAVVERSIRIYTDPTVTLNVRGEGDRDGDIIVWPAPGEHGSIEYRVVQEAAWISPTRATSHRKYIAVSIRGNESR